MDGKTLTYHFVSDFKKKCIGRVLCTIITIVSATTLILSSLHFLSGEDEIIKKIFVIISVSLIPCVFFTLLAAYIWLNEQSVALEICARVNAGLEKAWAYCCCESNLREQVVEDNSSLDFLLNDDEEVAFPNAQLSIIEEEPEECLQPTKGASESRPLLYSGDDVEMPTNRKHELSDFLINADVLVETANEQFLKLSRKLIDVIHDDSAVSFNNKSSLNNTPSFQSQTCEEKGIIGASYKANFLESNSKINEDPSIYANDYSEIVTENSFCSRQSKPSFDYAKDCPKQIALNQEKVSASSKEFLNRYVSPEGSNTISIREETVKVAIDCPLEIENLESNNRSVSSVHSKIPKLQDITLYPTKSPQHRKSSPANMSNLQPQSLFKDISSNSSSGSEKELSCTPPQQTQLTQDCSSPRTVADNYENSSNSCPLSKCVSITPGTTPGGSAGSELENDIKPSKKSAPKTSSTKLQENKTKKMGAISSKEKVGKDSSVRKSKPAKSNSKIILPKSVSDLASGTSSGSENDAKYSKRNLRNNSKRAISKTSQTKTKYDQKVKEATKSFKNQLSTKCKTSSVALSAVSSRRQSATD